MREYKCISCGAVKESDKECSCPVCGYKMFEVPYEKSEVLRKEIRRFVEKLRPTEFKSSYLQFYRLKPTGEKNDSGEDLFQIIFKKQDDERFPDFAKIQGYVCASKKTEVFLERIKESIEEIKKHLHAEYAQDYDVSTEELSLETNALDSVLKEVLSALGVKADLPELNLPEIKLSYSEAPNDSLLPTSDKLLELLSAIADKIAKFIKQNNIYGTGYQRKPKITFKPSEPENTQEDLLSCVRKVEKIIAKKYSVDIFSDGSDELSEMLGVLWNSAYALMTLPIQTKTYSYVIDGGAPVINDEIRAKLHEIISSRYEEIDSEVYAYDFLGDRNDNQLFELFDKMIELDSFGFMGVNKDGLLKIGESEAKLNKLIGLKAIKESIKKIKAYALANKDSDDLNIHMCFYGNPGTGKTEVARYIAGILYENKILPTKKIIEVDRSGLVSQYFGATAEKTQRVIHQAMGGVLFIDEAYALGNNSGSFGISDYGKEAIDTLVKAMGDYRGKFCVIFAGYKNEMLQMISTNPGLRSRIQFELDFPNYSRAELGEITNLILNQRGYHCRQDTLSRILDITDIKRKDPNFANAREIRNILDQVIMCQNLRCADSDDKEIGIVDVNKYIKDAKINLPTAGDGIGSKIMTGEEELDQLIGLASIKRMVKKIKAYAKRNKGDAGFNLHMCFYGNPGTGKTEVARILSRILYDAGVLDEAKLVETDAYGFLGKFVGETAPKTLAKINDAMNGVLFVDEAYALTGGKTADGKQTTYGEEAISVLLKEMEDRRGQFCVILAGYKEEMKSMLSSNPGLESRIQFTLDFPDYTREELGEIAERFLSKKKYTIENNALNRLLDITDYYRNQPNFANARTVRNVLDQVLMNQNLRTEDSDGDSTIILDDVNDYLLDEGIDLSNPNKGKRTIGFV